MTFTEPLQLAFIFDATILETLPGYQPGACLSDRRVAFIHSAVSEISERLSASDAHLIVRYGDPAVVIAELASFLPMMMNPRHDNVTVLLGPYSQTGVLTVFR